MVSLEWRMKKDHGGSLERAQYFERHQMVSRDACWGLKENKERRLHAIWCDGNAVCAAVNDLLHTCARCCGTCDIISHPYEDVMVVSRERKGHLISLVDLVIAFSSFSCACACLCVCDGWICTCLPATPVHACLVCCCVVSTLAVHLAPFSLSFELCTLFSIQSSVFLPY
ncbi:hypothetical protein BC939DRAFT_464235 [Gamsiella multidivaricata]|uniref:uncharacterized protein n=1 Tax=Gamsiella multidivaricata TaxID=101098 RepID=UPI0022206B3E|nr:uncharacterized protein BC939DRAFT_464235 [Gamsiella multidivaricata]KAI7817956.1 hypothetical protein BC939DRAFT_464235 [Gamsiella multidivaricata]